MANDYNREALSEEESKIFDGEWDKFVVQHFRNREVFDIYQDHKDAIKEACSIAKFQLDAIFGGMNAPSAQFGWTHFRPQFMKQTTSTYAYNTSTWNKDIATSDVTSTTTYGWLDFIGTSTAALKLSKYATAIILGFFDPVEKPCVDAVRIKLGATEYPILYFQDAIELQDYQVFELPTPIVVEKEQELYIQEHVHRAGRDSLRPFGVYYLKGDQLRSKTAYAQI